MKFMTIKIFYFILYKLNKIFKINYNSILRLIQVKNIYKKSDFVTTHMKQSCPEDSFWLNPPSVTRASSQISYKESLVYRLRSVFSL